MRQWCEGTYVVHQVSRGPLGHVVAVEVLNQAVLDPAVPHRVLQHLVAHGQAQRAVAVLKEGLHVAAGVQH